MLKDFLSKNGVKSQAKFVEYGYGQVEPNHLSAQRNGQIYAQLPADSAINVLENGQFVKYDYASGKVNFTGKGEWMLVFNQIKLYHDGQSDCEFAMHKDDYMARIYSLGGAKEDKQSRYYNGQDAENESIEDVTARPDIHEPYYNEDPFHILGGSKPVMMPEGCTMVPTVFKTMVGDIMTLNLVDEESLAVGDELTPKAENGILAKVDGESSETPSMI